METLHSFISLGTVKAATDENKMLILLLFCLNKPSQTHARRIYAAVGGGFMRRLPPIMLVTLTKRRVYFRRFMARPVGFLDFSWASTLGV